jgi:hypothetical protein
MSIIFVGYNFDFKNLNNIFNDLYDIYFLLRMEFF